ncbi:MAG: VWA domain-containing protein [Candidatus Omnitrophota bacterium]|nr:VWA domain-containing protein [Candidatus Omnitrophota bacterium]
MNWAAPVYLNFLLLIPVLVIFFVFIGISRRKKIERFGDTRLVEKLSSSKSLARAMIKKVLAVVAVSFLILALARPQIGSKLTLAKRYGVDILIAIDTSSSMLAQDIKPNRLEKAKLEISSFIEKLKGDRVGILTFAGDSFMQCPLTLDYGAAKMFLSVIEPGMMPRPGTAIGDAIRMASKGFTKKERKYKVMVLLTDGEDHNTNPAEAANEAKKDGIIIYAIGMGTKKGEPIPVVDRAGNINGYKKDKRGEVVMTKLDEETLQKVAVITGGKYYHATANEFELDKIYDDISKMEKKELSDRLFAQYEDRFQYFLGIAFILLCMEFIIGDRKRT